MREQVQFTGHDNHTLAGLLDAPDGEIKGYALFAHCFTCGKDVVAASRIARSLVSYGFAILRFDFSGVGSSEGEFEDTNFSSNVQDLVAAADFLREHYQAPQLLIGHSLGGAAVLAGANHVPESVGVVTIGAPADPAHVAKQFSCSIGEIEEQGKAKVDLAGREFTIKKQLLDDLEDQEQADKIANLNKALLIFHSPIDNTVLLNNAEKIYRLAKHPKSFISLDKANHLVTNKDDAEYIASIISAWAIRFLDHAS